MVRRAFVGTLDRRVPVPRAEEPLPARRRPARHRPRAGRAQRHGVACSLPHVCENLESIVGECRPPGHPSRVRRAPPPADARRARRRCRPTRALSWRPEALWACPCSTAARWDSYVPPGNERILHRHAAPQPRGQPAAGGGAGAPTRRDGAPLAGAADAVRRRRAVRRAGGASRHDGLGQVRHHRRAHLPGERGGQWSGTHGQLRDPGAPAWGFGTALRLADPALFDDSVSGPHPLWSRPPREMRRNLMAARLATIAVTLVGGSPVARGTPLRRRAGAGDLRAVVPLAQRPGHGSLATLDGWVTASYAPCSGRACACGIVPRGVASGGSGACLALAAACKATALGLLPVACGSPRAAAPPRARGGAHRPRVLAGAAGGAFVLTMWPSTASAGRRRYACSAATSRACPPIVFGPLPFKPLVRGAARPGAARRPRPSRLPVRRGRPSGWWWFYLAALALKTTIGAQALALSARWPPGPERGRPARSAARGRGAPGLPARCSCACMSPGKAQNGHPLPPSRLPLRACCGRAARPGGRRARLRARRAGRWRPRPSRPAPPESLAVHPHHLMFFNRVGGRTRRAGRATSIWRRLGPGPAAAGRMAAREPALAVFYTYYSACRGTGASRYEPPPCEPQAGLYALHAVEVHRPSGRPRAAWTG